MRTITSDTQSRIDAASEEDPLYILKLTIGSVVRWYADRTETLGGVFLDGRISSMGTLTTQARIDNTDRWFGSVGVIPVVLLDEDNVLKTALEADQLQGSAAEVYLAFSGQVQSDWTLLLKGKIEAPGEWDDDDRTLSFDVETPRREEAVPFTPEASDGLDVDEDFEGQTWPMMFGDAVRDGLAQMVKKPPQSTLVQDVDQDATSFVVENADEDFPQGTAITLQVGDEYVTGSFSGETFTVTARQVDRASGSGLSGNGAEITLPVGLRAVGTYIAIRRSIASDSQSLMTGYCYEQEGRVARIWNGNSSFTVSATYGYRINRYPFSIASGAQWVHKSGTKVTQVNVDTVYVASEVPLNTVYRVSAWRQVTNDDTGYSRRELVALDPSIFTVNLTNSAYKGGTTITLDLPLSARGAGWEDEIYVSAKSTVGSNTSDIIKWLIQNRSDLTVDAASFASVKTAVAKYPMNFTIRTPEDVLDLCADIAWQARCAITWNGSATVLRYLSAEPSSTDISLVNETVAEGEILETATPVTDLTTIFNAEWKRNQKDEEPRRIVLRNNVALYGKREKTFQFWAYQKRSLVLKSAEFWAARYSRSWRTMEVGLWGYEGMGIDPFDYAAWNISDFYASVSALVLSAEVTQDDQTKLIVQLPIEAGTIIQSDDYWDDDTGDPAAVTPTIGPGNTEIEKVSAEAPPAITFGDDPDNTFRVQAVTNEIGILVGESSLSTFREVDVRIIGTTESEITSQIAANDVRIAEIDTLDPAPGSNATLQAERASLVAANASLASDLDTAEQDGQVVTAKDQQSAGFMRAGDLGTMIKVPGGDYVVTPDNAVGPFVAEVTEEPSSPASGTLHADIGTNTIPTGSGAEVEINILGETSGISEGDKLLVFRDSDGKYYSSAPGGGGRSFLGKILGTRVVLGGNTQSYRVLLDNGLSVTAIQQSIIDAATIPTNTYVVVVKKDDGTYVMQVPVWL